MAFDALRISPIPIGNLSLPSDIVLFSLTFFDMTSLLPTYVTFSSFMLVSLMLPVASISSLQCAMLFTGMQRLTLLGTEPAPPMVAAFMPSAAFIASIRRLFPGSRPMRIVLLCKIFMVICDYSLFFFPFLPWLRPVYRKVP